LDKALNETIMVIGGTEIRVLDENKEVGLIAPSQDVTNSMWINLFVDDIDKQCKVAEDSGCVIISPVTKFSESNAINAVFSDKYGHVWVVNQKMN
jgi:PhnB protein